MARIYTRTGDQGVTSLFNGQRKSKANPRVDLYGQVDELNSWLGACAAHLGQIRFPEKTPKKPGQPQIDLQAVTSYFQKLQADLLEMGAILADPGRAAKLAEDPKSHLPFSAEGVEAWIDRLSGDLPSLRSFILPGGHPVAASLHICRTVCRRVERQAVNVRPDHTFPLGIIAYLNRLGDFLFVAALWVNQLLGVAEVVWHPKPNDPKEGGS
jgi:cob(I)alamin adenosyltransferase